MNIGITPGSGGLWPVKCRTNALSALYSLWTGFEAHKLISWRLMSKEDSIEVTGTVVEKFPSGLFSVQLDQDRTVLAHLAGKLRRNRIRVLAGDRVTLEMSPYDLTKGRITYRHK
jgi:translation initiation factor IF-1